MDAVDAQNEAIEQAIAGAAMDAKMLLDDEPLPDNASMVVTANEAREMSEASWN
jgi:hypothetical protein